MSPRPGGGAESTSPTDSVLQRLLTQTDIVLNDAREGDCYLVVPAQDSDGATFCIDLSDDEVAAVKRLIDTYQHTESRSTQS